MSGGKKSGNPEKGRPPGGKNAQRQQEQQKKCRGRLGVGCVATTVAAVPAPGIRVIDTLSKVRLLPRWAGTITVVVVVVIVVVTAGICRRRNRVCLRGHHIFIGDYVGRWVTLDAKPAGAPPALPTSAAPAAATVVTALLAQTVGLAIVWNALARFAVIIERTGAAGASAAIVSAFLVDAVGIAVVVDAGSLGTGERHLAMST
jgi:hypothetical protein